MEAFKKNKWLLMAGCFFLLIFICIACSVSSLWSVQPDYCIAYVGSDGLTDDMYRAIESAFTDAGEDVNGDQKIVIQIRQYVIPEDRSADEELMTAQLTADINSCESYFFLLQNPKSFQYSFGLLRYVNGVLPALDDYSSSGKTVLVSESSFFSQALESLSAQEADFMGSLSIGARGFWTDKTCKYVEESDALWEKIVL